jgi:hypothetical protein
LLDIGYFTAITMCYFLVEGFQYTRSKKKYAGRLLLFALLSEVPYCLAFSEGETLRFCGMNMMFTLLLCFLILLVTERVSNRVWKVLAIVGLTVLSLISDWPLLAPVFTLLFARARGSVEKTRAAFVCSALLFGAMNFAIGVGSLPIATNLVHAAGGMLGIAAAAVVILCCYNGERMERGRTFSKWFFYWFYPGHLLLLGLLRISL